MPTPKEIQRTIAFKEWLKHVGNIDAAQEITGIRLRSLQRMESGKQPPPVRLLEELADAARRNGATNIANALQLAAMPNSGQITGIWVDEADSLPVIGADHA